MSSLFPPAVASLEQLHPSLWRGSQLGRPQHRCIPTGHAELSAALPGGGWPVGTLTELLLAKHGIGEIRLLQPALGTLAPHRRIVLLQPPYAPYPAGQAGLPFAPAQLLWLRPRHVRDALWAAEQILKNGSCGALLYWQPQLRSASLRRLHLAALSSDTLFFLFRQSDAVQSASPAPLRLLLQAAPQAMRIDIVKRRGPRHDHPLFLPVTPGLAPPGPLIAPSPFQPHDALVDQRAPDATQRRRPLPADAAQPVFTD